MRYNRRLKSQTEPRQDQTAESPDTNGGGRERMTVWASFDRGETWPVKRLVYQGPSAYSSLAAGSDGTVYLLFERGEQKLYEHIAVVRFDLDWIRESGL